MKKIFWIILFGLVLRSWNLFSWYNFNHDQDLVVWFIRDVLENGHLRLIGQETSQHGVFIGPIFYYLQTIFYLIFNKSVLGFLFLPLVISSATIWSYYFVLKEIFDENVGLVGSFIYATSSVIVFTDREPVPTVAVFLWSIWFLYSIHLILKKKFSGFFLAIVLSGFVWHINLALALLLPTALIAWGMSFKKYKVKQFIFSVLIWLLLISPLLLFEIKHGFIQYNAIFNSVGDSIISTDKIDRVMQLVKTNVKNIVVGNRLDISYNYPFVFIVLGFIYLVYQKIIDKKFATILSIWFFSFILFFSYNKLNPSEYYFNGISVLWILILSLVISNLLNYSKSLGFVTLLIYFLVNFNNFINYKYPSNGYKERLELTEYIKKDAVSKNYPCVSVSYIVSPGNNQGYRYFFYRQGIHVNLPKSGSPVYTIVFPQSLVDHFDKSFGSLGLILPDYSKYNLEDVLKSCDGVNANLTEPMNGFTN